MRVVFAWHVQNAYTRIWAKYTDQVANRTMWTPGLHFLHSYAPEPILHRDVKSRNFLVNHHGIVKLADFGACALPWSFYFAFIFLSIFYSLYFLFPALFFFCWL